MARSPLQTNAPGAGPPTFRQWNRAAAATTAVAALLIFCLPVAGEPQGDCRDWSAELSVVEGSVELRRNGAAAWAAVVGGERICRGDTLRVRASSRAAVTLPDQSTLRLDEHTTLAFPEPDTGNGSLVDVIRGLIHVISRDPRSLRFTTPYANAGLEGTEFDIKINEREARTEIAVLEGEVAVTTSAGSLGATSGHLALARRGEVPTAIPITAPIELMRWAAHYPVVVAGDLPAADDPPSAAQARDAEFFARRAAARLATARLEAANEDLATARGIDADHPTALAVEAMIALARADYGAARALTTAALAASPGSVPAWISASYWQQGTGDLGAAATSIDRALALEPDNAIAATRFAELLLARGETAASVAAATRATALAPQSGGPQTVLGFAHLGRLDPGAAARAFEDAIEREPAAPLPRLGLALATIQAGDLDAGRRHLEMAVALDPTNALTRSYMAKVYETENRIELTATQLDLAKSFDPVDPTPWLYAALQKLRTNRPVEALQDLTAATSKNGNRAVFRSRLALDEDLATRSAGLGRLHAELGFPRLALADAWQAVADEPADYASHRLLADVYSLTPQHEVTRISELLVSQLLQPINVTPVKPQLAQPALFITRRVAPSQTSFSELSPPVTRNGLRLEASAVGGTTDVAGTDVSVAGLRDNISFGAGQYRFATDGFRANNDLDQRIANAFVHARPNPDTSLQAELRATRTQRGDSRLAFDPHVFDALIRSNEEVESIRFGAHRSFTHRDDLLASIILQDVRTELTRRDAFELIDDASGYSVDVQHLHAGTQFRLQSGLMHTSQDVDHERHLLLDPGQPQTVDLATSNRNQSSLYSYVHYRLSPSLTLTAGAALDRLRDEPIYEDALSPKLGILWRPSAETTVRAAAFRSLYSSLTASRYHAQPRLEPVQIAGFSQLLFGGQADDADVAGLAVDHALSERLFVGWEATRRDTDRAVRFPFNPAGSEIQTVHLSETSQLLYGYWTPTDRVSFSAQYEHGRWRSRPFELFGYTTMKMDRLPLEARYFGPRGLTAGARASGVHQTGTFLTASTEPGPPTLTPSSERFWVVDAFVGYRLPNRRGVVSISADNLFDKQYRFQDVDPENPGLLPERLVSVRFTVSVD